MVIGGLFLLVLAFACGLAYELIGSRTDADGWLQEPFALIPLSWLFSLAGLSLVTVGLWRRSRQRGTCRGNGPGNDGDG